MAEGVKVLLPSNSLLPFRQMIISPGAVRQNGQFLATPRATVGFREVAQCL